MLYGLTSALISAGLVVRIFLYNTIILIDKPNKITGLLSVSFPTINLASSGILAILNYIDVTTIITSFIVGWLGTALLLHHYSRWIGQLQYGVLVSLPLISFLAGVFPTILFLSGDRFAFYDQQFLFFRVLFKSTVTVAGFLYAIVFLQMAKNLSNSNFSHRHNKTGIKDYLTVSAYGIVMMIVSLQAPVYHAPYPPFGIAATSFVALASYIFMLGFYSSAISVSEDGKLRQTIRKAALHESTTLLGSIGTAELMREMQSRIQKIAADHSDQMVDMTGIQSSLAEDEIKQYIDDVLTEIKGRKSS